MKSTNDPIADWVAQLASRDHLTRLRTVDALRTHPPDMVRDVILAALADRRANAQASAARLAGERGFLGALDTLEQLAADAGVAVRVRKASVVALGHLGQTSGLAALGSAVDHPNAMVRRAAVESAGRIGTVGALTMLLRGLRDGAWQVRMDAAIGIGGMPSAVASDAFDGLDAAWSVESESRTGERMLRAMAELGFAGEGLRQRVGSRLIGVLASSEDWRWRRAAARGLGELKVAEARETLERRAKTSRGAVAEEVAWALRALEMEP